MNEWNLTDMSIIIGQKLFILCMRKSSLQIPITLIDKLYGICFLVHIAVVRVYDIIYWYVILTSDRSSDNVVYTLQSRFNIKVICHGLLRLEYKQKQVESKTSMTRVIYFPTLIVFVYRELKQRWNWFIYICIINYAYILFGHDFYA